VRVAFVTLQYPPHGVGGIGSYVHVVATALAGAGHDVTVVSAARGQRRSTSVEAGVTVERFGVLGPSWIWERLVRPRQTSRVRLHHAASGAWALLRTRRRFDVVEAPEWKAQGLLLRLVRRGRVVVHVHLPLELEQAWNGAPSSPGQRLSHRMELATARLAHARTSTSRQTLRRPDGTTWLPERDVTVVAPPLDLDRWSACRPVSDATPRTVLCVGRLERRKAPELLVAALGRLVDDVPGLRAVFVGGAKTADGRPYDEVVDELATRHGVACEIVPPTADPDEVLRWYETARVVAVPSRFETLSMVALEALACGRPAVVTDAVGAAELIGPVLPELVVPSGDAAALAVALRPLLLDSDRAAEVGARGRDLVAAACAPARVVGDRIGVYRAVGDGAVRA
jgi:glycosyltransferase involved in cell wall biosynthesis